MSTLTRDAFLAPAALPKEEVAVPGIGTVFVRAMTAGELDRFSAAHDKLGSADFHARVTAATACDADGALLFTPADVPALSALPAAALRPVAEAALRLNAMDGGAREEMRKN